MAQQGRTVLASTVVPKPQPNTAKEDRDRARGCRNRQLFLGRHDWRLGTERLQGSNSKEPKEPKAKSASTSKQASSSKRDK
jgi:hypothetical protein